MGHQLLSGHAVHLAYPVPHCSHVPHRLHYIACACLSLGAHHPCSLSYPAQRLTQVSAATYERHFEVMLVDVVALVGRSEHLTLIDVVDADRLQYPRFDEVADAALSHDWYAHSFHDGEHPIGIGHASHAS